MTAQNLQDMSLGLDQVQATVRFLEAYANTALAELEALHWSDGPVDRTPGPSGFPLTEEPAFSVAADAATSLREAGQWLLYLDPGRAADLLAHSGRLFRDMGQPFGLYLLAMTGDVDRDPPYAMVGKMLDVVGRGWTAADDGPDAWPALRHPQQQTYLLLAAAGSRPLRDEFRYPLEQITENSVHRRGVLPVGALGTPIRYLWDVARHLAAERPESVRVVSQHLVGMCRRYAETMALAQVNTYLWSNGAAPVDVGDVDIAGIAALTARRYGGDTVLGALGNAGLRDGDERIALAPVAAGLALADPWRSRPRGG